MYRHIVFKSKNVIFNVVAMAVGFFVISSTAGGADTPSVDLRIIRDKACGSMQADFDQIEADHVNDPHFLVYHKRIADMEGIAKMVLADLARHRADFLARTTASEIEKGQQKAVGAKKIFLTGRFQLAGPLPNADFTYKRNALLQKYYEAYAEGLENFICFYAHERVLGGASSDEANEVIRLCLVIPFLQVPDESWSERNFDALPQWLTDRRQLSLLESTALHFQLPTIAYYISCKLHNKSKISEQDAPRKFIDYLQANAVAMQESKVVRDQDIPAAVACWKTLAEFSKAQHFNDLEQKTRLMLANSLDDNHDPKAAEKEIAIVLANGPNDEEYARAVSLKLRFLFEEKDFSSVVQQATTYRDDDHCKNSLPQILYLGWAATRQINSGTRPDAAESWRKAFLDRFPFHPLAADLYFDIGMTYLSQANYEEGDKFFAMIELRFPASDIIDHVHKIREQLAIPKR